MSKSSAYCVDVSGQSKSPGAEALQSPCDGGTNQSFIFTKRSDGYYQIQDANSLNCLRPSGGAVANGTPMIMDSCSSSETSEEYSPVEISAGVYQLIDHLSGTCLDVTNNAMTQVQLQLWTCDSTVRKTWALTLPSASQPSPTPSASPSAAPTSGAPTSISYSPSTLVLNQNQAMAPALLSHKGGAPAQVFVSPALPAGLSINQSNGTISGTPTQVTAAKSYGVGAENSSGNAWTSISIQVVASASPSPKPSTSPSPSPSPSTSPSPKPSTSPSPKPSTSPSPAPTGGIGVHYSSKQGNTPPGGSFPYFPSSPYHVALPFNPVFVSSSQSQTWNQENSPGQLADLTISEDASTGGDDPTYYTDGDGSSFTLACNKQSYSAYSCGINAYNPRGLINMNGATVSFPLGAIPAGDSDHHILDINTTEGYEDDIWLGKPMPSQANQTWSVGGAGRCALDGDGTGCSGSTATNMALSMGLIRAEDILYCLNSSSDPTHCTLPYALAVAPKCNGKNFTYPATASDGQCFDSSGTNHSTSAGLPEGERGCLNMTDDQINALPYPAYEKVVYRTMDCQHYGVFDRDSNWSGGPGFVFQNQGGEAYAAFGHTDPWRTLASQAGISVSGSTFTIKFTDLKNPDFVWCSNSKNDGLCD